MAARTAAGRSAAAKKAGKKRRSHHPGRCPRDRQKTICFDSAPPPMAGETLGAYKRRMVQPWQQFSPALKHSNLHVRQAAESVAFATAIQYILARADAEGRNPPRFRRAIWLRTGALHEVLWAQITWMAPFMPRGRQVKSINRNHYQRA
jgi:hypothetical protein